MKTVFLLLLFLLLSFTEMDAIHSQEYPLDGHSFIPYADSLSGNLFPEKCLGVWEGTMLIYQSNRIQDSVDVRFTAARTSVEGTYIWKTEYLSEKYPIVKDYKLVVDDPVKGSYILDEGDGLYLREYQIADKLYCLFKVEDTYLTASTELVGEQLIFEVTSGKALDVAAGVQNYSYTNVQRVVLKKVKP